MKFFLLLFLVLPLFGIELVGYNVYDRNDRVDLMLSFDNAYNGKISQTKEQNLTLFTFSDLKYSKDELKEVNSQLVDKISISSKNNNTYIMLQNRQNVSFEVSSINDKFGVRIRAVEQEAATQTIIPSLNSTQELMPKPKSTSLEGYDYTNYILIMLVLFILFILFWWLKKIILYKNNGISRDFNMVFQRFLDKNNQLIVFEYADKRYTMIIGNSNMLLENVQIPTEDQIFKHPNNKEKNFDSFFEENKKRIQNLIEQNKRDKSNS